MSRATLHLRHKALHITRHRQNLAFSLAINIPRSDGNAHSGKCEMGMFDLAKVSGRCA